MQHKHENIHALGDNNYLTLADDTPTPLTLIV